MLYLQSDIDFLSPGMAFTSTRNKKVNKLRLKILLLLITFSVCGYAQRQGNIWYFGEGLGLDFNQDPVTVLTDGQIDKYALHYDAFSEGCSSISTSEGELLFYTNGEFIWNRNHIIMLNGSGLMGHESSTNAGLIVPVPGKNAMYYVFTTDAFQVGLTNGLRYSIVDMCGDSGMGEVLTKNVLLLNTSGERLAFTKHANGVDYWLVAHLHFSTAFYAYLITESGNKRSRNFGDRHLSRQRWNPGRNWSDEDLSRW